MAPSRENRFLSRAPGAGHTAGARLGLAGGTAVHKSAPPGRHYAAPTRLATATAFRALGVLAAISVASAGRPYPIYNCANSGQPDNEYCTLWPGQYCLYGAISQETESLGDVLEDGSVDVIRGYCPALCGNCADAYPDTTVTVTATSTATSTAHSSASSTATTTASATATSSATTTGSTTVTTEAPPTTRDIKNSGWLIALKQGTHFGLPSSEPLPGLAPITIDFRFGAGSLIIRRDCPSCIFEYQTVYYKRLTPYASCGGAAGLLQVLQSQFVHPCNVRGVDFDLYSDYFQAIGSSPTQRNSAWEFCPTQSIPGVGAFGYCAPFSGFPQPSVPQWNSWSAGRGGQSAIAFLIDVVGPEGTTAAPGATTGSPATTAAVTMTTAPPTTPTLPLMQGVEITLPDFTITGLSASELQRLKDQLLAEFIASSNGMLNASHVAEIRLTAGNSGASAAGTGGSTGAGTTTTIVYILSESVATTTIDSVRENVDQAIAGATFSFTLVLDTFTARQLSVTEASKYFRSGGGSSAIAPSPSTTAAATASSTIAAPGGNVTITIPTRNTTIGRSTTPAEVDVTGGHIFGGVLLCTLLVVLICAVAYRFKPNVDYGHRPAVAIVGSSWAGRAPASPSGASTTSSIHYYPAPGVASPGKKVKSTTAEAKPEVFSSSPRPQPSASASFASPDDDLTLV